MSTLKARKLKPAPVQAMPAPASPIAQVSPVSNKSIVRIHCGEAVMALMSLTKLASREFGAEYAKLGWSVASALATLRGSPEVIAGNDARIRALKNHAVDMSAEANAAAQVLAKELEELKRQETPAPADQVSAKQGALQMQRNIAQAMAGQFRFDAAGEALFQLEWEPIADQEIEVVITKIPAAIRAMPLPPGIIPADLAPITPFVVEEV